MGIDLNFTAFKKTLPENRQAVLAYLYAIPTNEIKSIEGIDDLLRYYDSNAVVNGERVGDLPSSSLLNAFAFNLNISLTTSINAESYAEKAEICRQELERRLP